MKILLKNIHSCQIITVAICVLAGVLLTLTRRIPDTEGQDAVRQLSNSTHLDIQPESVMWISGAPTGSFSAALTWHEIVFLGRRDNAKARELYRAEVRALDKDRIFGIRNVRNLSKTKVGDEFTLTAAASRVAAATQVLGQIRSITIYDFNKQAATETGEWSSVTRWLNRITNWMETGKAAGLDRKVVRFARPPVSVTMAFSGDKLRVQWEDLQGEVTHTEIPPDGAISEKENLTVTSAVTLAKRPVLWLVDTIRGLSWVGPGPIEWAEGRFFALKDAVTRTRYALFGDEELGEEDTPAAESKALAPAVLNLPPGLEIGKDDREVWPPPKFDPPVYKRRLPGEGTWQPFQPAFLKALPGAPPAFYRSITRPDGARPYIKVHLFAMDMRQLEIHMVGGHEDPQSTTGSTGTGHFPRRPEILNRLVAAFNGAFKTEHGEYGMIVEKDVLLPPQPRAATVASLEDGTTLVGSWPEGFSAPESLVSLRQNMDPVVENGVVNPRRRYLWGFTLDEDITKMHTIRSGVCMSDKGYLVYAWGEDLTAQTLGTAMNAAGCVYGVHLDMNPFHTSFIFYDIADYQTPGERPEFKAEVALKEMRYSPHRYINGAPKDFFFLTLRDSSPGPGWTAEGIAQPAPAFIPAVFRREKDGCTFLAVDRTRTQVRLDHGDIPSSLAPNTGAGKQEDIESDLLVIASLGPWSSTRGQLVGETVVATLSDHRATLGMGGSKALVIGPWPLQDAQRSIIGNAIQGNWLDDDAAPEGEVMALAVKGDWLMIGLGQRPIIRREFEASGLTQGICFASSQAEKPLSLAVRGEKGMLDAAGNAMELWDRTAALRIVARPKPLGARRLETAFGQPMVEAKKK